MKPGEHKQSFHTAMHTLIIWGGFNA